jgi:hypothetical protein
MYEYVMRILLQDLDFAIVVDLKSHGRILTYLKKKGLYMVGLVPVTYSPWRVAYPVPAFSDSHLTQYYFLRLVIHLKSSAFSARHRYLYYREAKR